MQSASATEPALVVERATGACRVAPADELTALIGPASKRAKSIKLEGVVGLLSFPDERGLLVVTDVRARRTRTGPSVPMVCLACAHWAKFPDANVAALGKAKAESLVVPEPLASLHTLPTRVKMLPNDVQTVQTFVDETIA